MTALDLTGAAFLFGLDGSSRGQAGGPQLIEGLPEPLLAVMNQGRVVRDRGQAGAFLFAHGTYPPRIQRFSSQGQVVQEIHLEDPLIRPAVDLAKNQAQVHIENHRAGYVSILTAVRRHPAGHQIWAGSHPGHLRAYSASGDLIQTFQIIGRDRKALLFADFDFLGDSQVLFVYSDELYRAHLGPISETTR